MSHPEDFLSFQNHQDVGFFGSVVGGATLLLSIPAWLWRLYVDYLWKWHEHPWIVSAAATFKLLAIVVITPFALLSLLDVGAYVIARTLGVVETTRASTSDSKHVQVAYIPPESDGSETEMTHVETPSPHVERVAPAAAADGDDRAGGGTRTFDLSEDTHEAVAYNASPSRVARATGQSQSKLKARFDAKLEIPIQIPHARYTHFGRSMQGDGPEAEACFFSPSDERQLELSGALLSSPTPSRQASPGLERRQRLQMQPLTVEKLHTYEPASATTTSASSDSNSTADSEPFTILESSDLNRDGAGTIASGGPECANSAPDATAGLRKRGVGPRDDDGIGTS